LVLSRLAAGRGFFWIEIVVRLHFRGEAVAPRFFKSGREGSVIYQESKSTLQKTG
jgi:hypothetical protein